MSDGAAEFGRLLAELVVAAIDDRVDDPAFEPAVRTILRDIPQSTMDSLRGFATAASDNLAPCLALVRGIATRLAGGDASHPLDPFLAWSLRDRAPTVAIGLEAFGVFTGDRFGYETVDISALIGIASKAGRLLKGVSSTPPDTDDIAFLKMVNRAQAVGAAVLSATGGTLLPLLLDQGGDSELHAETLFESGSDAFVDQMVAPFPWKPEALLASAGFVWPHGTSSLDDRYGLGFRLAPHSDRRTVDWQCIVEASPGSRSWTVALSDDLDAWLSLPDGAGTYRLAIGRDGGGGPTDGWHVKVAAAAPPTLTGGIVSRLSNRWVFDEPGVARLSAGRLGAFVQIAEHKDVSVVRVGTGLVGAELRIELPDWLGPKLRSVSIQGDVILAADSIDGLGADLNFRVVASGNAALGTPHERLSPLVASPRPTPAPAPPRAPKVGRGIVVADLSTGVDFRIGGAEGGIRISALGLVARTLEDDFGFRIDAVFDVAIKAGPLVLVAHSIGCWTGWWSDSPTEPTGLSGGFHAPQGLGADFQTAALQGGGYLERQDNDGYAGAFALRFSKFSLAGLAVFESAEGAPSILVMAELSLPSAIPIGLGFELSRLGAVLGLNRTIDMEAMRSSVRTGAIGALLGDGMVEHANEVLPTLRSFFPARKGSHVLGPVARVSWLKLGSGHLVNADLALAIEVPSFARVALLGSARVQIPDLPNLLKLRIDFAGGIDFSARQLWFDASLIDSEALELFQVTGDVALRLLWGDRPAFLLSVGGFHRDYKPEIPNMPTMRRLGLTLNRGMGGIELRAEAYLAITSNTFQAGGRLSARLSAGSFAIHGSLQIDTLVQFAPFRFDIAFDVEFGVEVFGFSLLSLRVHGRVAGPGPLEITAGIEIDLFFFSIEFEHTFVIGNSVPQDVEPPLDIEEVKRELADALARHTAVRSAALADPAVALNLRTVAADDPVIVVSPLAAAHAVQQKVPLDVPITHIGPPRFQAPVTLRVTSSMQAPSGAPTEPFSPGTFIDVSGEAQQLALPSFEQHAAGLRFEFPLTFSSTMATASLEPRPTHIPEVQLIGALGDLMPMRVAALFGAGSGVAAVQTTAPRLSVTDERFGLDGSSALQAVGSNQLDRPLFRTAPVHLVSL